MIQLLGKDLRKKDIAELKDKASKNVNLTFYLVYDPSFNESCSYVNSIIKTLDKVGWQHVTYKLTKSYRDYCALNKIRTIKDSMVILARPVLFDEETLISLIDYRSDPDMLTDFSKGKLYSGNLNYLPATAMSVRRLVEYYNIDCKGKKVLVIGRSISVGLPIFMYFQRKNATCTLAHSKTEKMDLNKAIIESDIIVLATGKQGLIDRKFLNNKQIVIDCGYHSNGTGDLGFVPNDNELYAYTPVPGGVGPLTITSLLKNALLLHTLYKKSKEKELNNF